MAKHRLKPNDRQALKYWDELVASIRNSSDINTEDTPAEIEIRRRCLEADNEAWFQKTAFDTLTVGQYYEH